MITLNELSEGVFRHPTPLGPLRSVWTDKGLYSLNWSNRQADPLAAAEAAFCSDPDGAGMLDELLREYFSIGAADFGAIVLDQSDTTPFRRTVYRCCREIPSGSTATYKQLAIRSGNASASRAVGAAMSGNRVLLVIPCHRVIGSQGRLCGFSGPGGLQTKQFLLDFEAR